MGPVAEGGGDADNVVKLPTHTPVLVHKVLFTHVPTLHCSPSLKGLLRKTIQAAH
jgi:hypothetical protein